MYASPQPVPTPRGARRPSSTLQAAVLLVLSTIAGPAWADPPAVVGDACSIELEGWAEPCLGSNSGCLRDAWFDYLHPNGLTVVSAAGPVQYASAAEVEVALSADPGLDQGVVAAMPGRVTALALNLGFSAVGAFVRPSWLEAATVIDGPYAGMNAAQLLDVAQAEASEALIEAIDAINGGFPCRTPVLPPAAVQAGNWSASPRWIVTLDPAGPGAAGLAAVLGGDPDKLFGTVLHGFAGALNGPVLDLLAAHPAVLSIEADVEVEAFQTLPTGVDRVDADLDPIAAIDGLPTLVDVDVAVLDTGIDLDHPDLNVVGGVSFVSHEPHADDGHGHGTHVGGTIAARDDGFGVVGVAPGARLHAVKVLDSLGRGYNSSVIAGLDWVASHPAGIEVANLSLGGPGGNDGNCGATSGDPLHQAICATVAAGVTVVVAAGNSSSDARAFTPAAYPEAITVSAYADFDGAPGGLGAPTCTWDADDSFASFSNFGPAVDLMAPGVCILSTWPGGGTQTLSGTSMAAPHVAGAAALLLAADPILSPAAVRAALLAEAEPTQGLTDDPDGIHEPLLRLLPHAEEPDPDPDPQEPPPAPEGPTPAPEEPTPAPEEPTPAPEEPTPAPEEPTPAPEEPTPPDRDDDEDEDDEDDDEDDDDRDGDDEYDDDDSPPTDDDDEDGDDDSPPSDDDDDATPTDDDDSLPDDDDATPTDDDDFVPDDDDSAADDDDSAADDDDSAGPGPFPDPLETCGDGVVDRFEMCDDGNREDFDGCSALCLLEFCGDGILQPTEDCDDANTWCHDGCSSSCTFEYCGDGELQCGEECDDGNDASDDGCTPLCTVEECGDGEVQGAEQCDDGNLESGDGCDEACVLEFCGDGIPQPIEQCDDGNLDADDGCSPSCAWECGDGVLHPAEECDDGNRTSEDGCSARCRVELVECPGDPECPELPFEPDDCGNGRLDLGESCDDGNTASGDGCSGRCALEFCGDGVLQPLSEQCDDGNADRLDGCDESCALEVCGDGVLQPGEACDDGNELSNDGCSDECLVEFCGDDVRQAGEGCDDGNNLNNDGCSFDCAVERCGDGVIQQGEECDDGNDRNGDGCTTWCTYVACGDGVLHAGEECDDGNRDDEDGCSGECVLEVCGDGILQPWEECDDGNHEPFDECGPDCALEVCGDGILQPWEACDDGNRRNSDGCSRSCLPEWCGDGIRQADEGCDDGNNDDLDGCNSVCIVECGDGLLQPEEECDDGNAMDLDGCSARCVVERCGDGVLQEPHGEQCDDGNEVSGDGCAGDCVLEYCGDGIVQPREGCDDGNEESGDGCSEECRVEYCGDAITQPREECDDGNGRDMDGCFECAVEYCGDGVRQLVEECDDGNDLADDGCDPECSLEYCGPGAPGYDDTRPDTPRPMNLWTAGDGSRVVWVERAVPGHAIQLTASPDYDPSTGCAYFLVDACLELATPTVVGVGTADANGNAAIPIPPLGPGITYVQAAVIGEPIPYNSDVLATWEVSGGLVSCPAASCGDPIEPPEPQCGTDEGTPASLLLFGDATLHSGAPFGLTATGAPGGSLVWFLGGKLRDTGPCPLQSAGISVDLQVTELLGWALADDAGEASITAAMGPLEAGSNYAFQAIVAAGPEAVKSNIVLRDVEAAPGPAVCGDGAQQVGEFCDDGNTVGGDGCSALCEAEGCGDGILQGVEECDDGNRFALDGCDGDCFVETCGNGELQPGEACDDGNTVDGDGCSSSCAFEVCGDGIIQAPIERCDDGNTRNNDGCSAWCRPEFCGDGIIQSSEACDGGPGCSAECTNTFVAVVAGESHSCGLADDGEVLCWGWSANGRTTPPAGPFTSLTAGPEHTCGLELDGSATCWGRNEFGEASPPPGSFTALAAARNHSCGVTDEGAIACWGANDRGQSNPPAGTGFVGVTVGAVHGCALQESGAVVCWGAEEDGRLEVPDLSAVAIEAGAHHTCAVDLGGAVVCWGRESFGRLDAPDGSFLSLSSSYIASCAQQVDASVLCWGGLADPPFADIVQVDVGRDHGCAVDGLGNPLCWGADDAGQSTPRVFLAD